MKVAIAGGHGKIALLLAAKLAEAGDVPLALIRNPDHSDSVAESGARSAVVDLENDSAQELADAIAGNDAVVFAAGAGPDSGAERKETVDYGGAVLLIEAAKLAGIERYVMVSAISADAAHQGDEVYDVYIRAKGRADDELAASGLDYTIVRPGGLTDDAGTGRVKAAEQLERGEIPRADVAEVLLASLHDDRTIGKRFVLVGGDEAIADALSAL
ncbi:SDR family oxidoreductase [soil metagenome]